MTKANIYTAITQYLVESGQVVDLDKLLSKWHTADHPDSSGSLILVDLLAALREDMRTETNKANGKAEIEKAMRAIIKNADAARPALQGAFMNGGMQCVCDGYRAIRLREAIDLPAPPVSDTFNLVPVFEGMYSSCQQPLELPTVADLKSHIKISTADARAKYGRNWKHHVAGYDFGEGKPLVNATYLLDILTAFPSATASTECENKPIFFKADAGDAILLPINRKENAQ